VSRAKRKTGPCARCGNDSWYRDSRGSRVCKHCQRARVTKRRNILQKDQAYRLWRNAQERARVAKVAFGITVADVQAVLGPYCPVFGTPWGRGREAPSLDRMRPARGYVPGNIAVISMRANAIKSDANGPQVLRVFKWMRKHGL